MPKIYEYLGIAIFFYAHEHEPIHVHGRIGKYETKAEFIISQGKIIEIRLRSVKRAKPLKGADLKNFETFIGNYSKQIVEKWIEFFVYKKEVSFERITKRIK